jgi:CheY-like chemotaxis protein
MNKVLIARTSDEERTLLKRLVTTLIDFLDTNDDNVFEAKDGLDIVSVIRNNPDIKYILLDVNMPVLSGSDAIDTLVKQGHLKDTKVIFITSENLPANVLGLECIKGSISDPIKADTIYEELRHLFFTKYELMSDEEKEELQRQIEDQKRVIVDMIIKYTSINEETSHVDSSHFMEDLNSYYEDHELIPENDLVPVAEEFIKKISSRYGVSEKIDKSKLNFFFDNKESVTVELEDTQLEDKDKIATFMSKDVLINDAKDYEAWEEGKREFDSDLNLELQRYIDIIKRHNASMKINKNLGKFIKLFDDKEIVALNTFLIKVVYDFAKTNDFSVETNKIKSLLKDINLLMRGKRFIATAEREKVKHDFHNTNYEEFISKYKKDFNIVLKYLHYTFIIALIAQMRQSDTILSMLMEGRINRITINSLIYYFTYGENYRKVESQKKELHGLTPQDFMTLKSKLHSTHSTVIYLSAMPVESNKDITTLKKVINQSFSSYELYGFARNATLDMWTNNRKAVDVVFLEDAYDHSQPETFAQIKQNYQELFKKSKVVLISTNEQSDNKKQLLEMSDTILKKPLNYEKVYKYLLSI